MLDETMLENKVSNSGIETLDLSAFYPKEEEMHNIDFKKYLFMELILKEKEYREQLKNEDFSAYQNKHVYITCSVEAVIPKWAFMLLTSYLNNKAKTVFFGTINAAKEFVFFQNFVAQCPTNFFIDKRVVLKGCGEVAISENAYIIAMQHLLPYAKSIMYGEPCSTVPIYKKK